MLLSIILGLVLLLFVAYLILLFFQVHTVEKRLADLIQDVEFHSLDKYGQIPNKAVKETDPRKAMESHD